MEEKSILNLSENMGNKSEAAKTGKTILKMRSFDLNKESSKIKQLPKTKSLNSHFIVNFDEIINCVSQDSFPNHSHEETQFLSTYESSLRSDNVLDPIRSVRSHRSDSSVAIDEEESDICSWQKMHIEPAFGISLKFEEVNYKVKMKGDNNSNVEKCILQGVSGSVYPGEVLALMGPSGGGKTTLLNLLSGRLINNSGLITYNDRIYTKALKRRIGFVLQDDTVFPHLTVKETLTYSALLRLPNTLSKEQKEERAMNVILELGLERCQNTMIGGNFVRGVSGGERKRVCIGNEILLNPSLLFLDEPTSGLDSTTALRIIQMLHNIAQAGKTVVTTIHQPSSRLFSIFDKLILLSHGCPLYFGKASDAMLYFSSIGCLPLIAMNPAEFLIDLANGNIRDKSIPTELEDKFLTGDERLHSHDRSPSPGDVHEYLLEAYESRASNLEKIGIDKQSLINHKNMCEDTEEYGANWSSQFWILFRRGLRERRHEYLSSLRIIQVVTTSIIVGLLWWNSKASSDKTAPDQDGLLFFISVFWAFFPVFTAIFTFPQERAMLAKERSVGMYKLSAYLIARNTSDLPLDLILPVIFFAIIYFMVGLKPTFAAFSQTLLTAFLSIIAAQGLGLSIGAAFMDVKKATTFASVTIMTFMLSGGFFIKRVPAFMCWIRYVSLNYHTYRLLLKIQNRTESPLMKGQGLDHVGSQVAAMAAMIVGYRLLTYVLLRTMKLQAQA